MLATDPYGCRGFPNHELKGRLEDYRTLDIDFEGFPIVWCIASTNPQLLNVCMSSALMSITLPITRLKSELAELSRKVLVTGRA
jgi:hypothetical protein